VQIWSHRGHLDAAGANTADSSHPSCDNVLHQLEATGIRHFDVDFLFVNGTSIVAHQTEMLENLGDFSTSPCSKIPLKEFLQKLKQTYGDDSFFLTMEPKSAWKDEPARDFLAPPEAVVGGILNVLEEESIAANLCGIILEESQWKDPGIAALENRMQKLVPNDGTVASYSRKFALLHENQVPSHDRCQILMPTSGTLSWATRGESSFLQESTKRGLKNILWVVDIVPTICARRFSYKV
jgi:hypothetical protein